MNYFGARYLDPMLGLWTSVDPARQYQNPYLYAGNNPVMRTDPDGNADEINQNILQDFFSGMFAFFNFKGQQTLDNVCETAAPYMEGVRKIYQVGAVFDPEPISRWGFSVGTIAFDTFDAFAEEGGGVVKTLISNAAGDFAGKIFKLPKNFIGRVASAFVSDETSALMNGADKLDASIPDSWKQRAIEMGNPENYGDYVD